MRSRRLRDQRAGRAGVNASRLSLLSGAVSAGRVRRSRDKEHEQDTAGGRESKENYGKEKAKEKTAPLNCPYLSLVGSFSPLRLPTAHPHPNPNPNPNSSPSPNPDPSAGGLLLLAATAAVAPRFPLRPAPHPTARGLLWHLAADRRHRHHHRHHRLRHLLIRRRAECAMGSPRHALTSPASRPPRRGKLPAAAAAAAEGGPREAG